MRRWRKKPPLLEASLLASMPPKSDQQCGQALGRGAWTGLQVAVLRSLHDSRWDVAFTASRNASCDFGMSIRLHDTAKKHGAGVSSSW